MILIAQGYASALPAAEMLVHCWSVTCCHTTIAVQTQKVSAAYLQSMHMVNSATPVQYELTTQVTQ